jgi:Holliday junction resolvasome RuvABC ATP-dependent DNA helicase subunit
LEGGILANEQNLRPIKLTHEEATIIGRNGGIASGEARRQRRRMREYAELVLDLPVKDKKKAGKLARMGINTTVIDNEMLLIVGLIEKAQGGDVSAAREVRSIIGEDTALPPGADDEHDGLFDAIEKAVIQREV